MGQVTVIVTTSADVSKEDLYEYLVSEIGRVGHELDADTYHEIRNSDLSIEWIQES